MFTQGNLLCSGIATTRVLSLGAVRLGDQIDGIERISDLHACEPR